MQRTKDIVIEGFVSQVMFAELHLRNETAPTEPLGA
jgi:hypothetical protein